MPVRVMSPRTLVHALVSPQTHTQQSCNIFNHTVNVAGILFKCVWMLQDMFQSWASVLVRSDVLVSRGCHICFRREGANIKSRAKT